MASKKKTPDTQKKQAPKSAAKKKSAGAKAKPKKTPAKKATAKKAPAKKAQAKPATQVEKKAKTPVASTTTSASATTFTIDVSDFVTPEVAETFTTVSGIAPLVIDSIENDASRKKLVAKLFGWLKKKN